MRYKDARDIYTDISLVFWNALYYNEPGSQIASDAGTLKVRNSIGICRNVFLGSIVQGILESEWKKRPILPSGRSSPPPASAQKVHKGVKPSPVHTPADSDTVSRQPSNKTEHKSAQRQPTPDMDVDIMTPEYDVQGNDGTTGPEMERDSEGEEIVKQLEKGLPQWSGFGEEGWMQEDFSVSLVHYMRVF